MRAVLQVQLLLLLQITHGISAAVVGAGSGGSGLRNNNEVRPVVALLTERNM